MLFNSYTFILVFLPFTLLAHRLALRCGPRLASASLLISSLIFYGYWSLAHTAWLVLSILVNHLVSRAMVHSKQAKLLAIAAIGFNLGLLGYFKYYGFFSNEILSHMISVEPISIILPIGISFFTFQQLAYIVDVYKGKAQPGDLLQYALFVTFFPQLIAGPIVHHAEILPQLTAKREDRIGDIQIGLAFFIIGLSKKLIMADGLSPIVGEIFIMAKQDAIGFVAAWKGALAYTLQIYFDFSGYSDMAIGLGWMFGIQLPLNFNAPYRATSIISFWRRWHITLSRFLREYLYFPLGGNRVSYGRTLVNIFIVMFLGGVWHGAGWTFIVWGLMHASAIVLNHVWRKLLPNVSVPAFWRWLATMLFVVFAWVVFRAPDLTTAMNIYAGMLGVNGVPLDAEALARVVSLTGIPFIDNMFFLFMRPEKQWLYRLVAGLGIVMLMPTTQYLLQYFPDQGNSNPGHCKLFNLGRLSWRPTPLWGCALGAVFGIAFLKLSSLSEFIYFQF